MASVSFIGPLVSAESDKVSPDIWYLQARYVHPPEPRLGVVRLLPASSSRYSMCTVTLALINAIESACADQCNDLDKQTSGLHCLSLCDSPVSFLRVFTREQRRNWQGGKFLHENDDYSHSSSNGNAIANAMHPPCMCHASLTNRPPGQYRSNSSEIPPPLSHLHCEHWENHHPHATTQRTREIRTPTRTLEDFTFLLLTLHPNEQVPVRSIRTILHCEHRDPFVPVRHLLQFHYVLHILQISAMVQVYHIPYYLFTRYF